MKYQEDVEEKADLTIARPAHVAEEFKRALARRPTPPKGASVTTLRLWHAARLEMGARKSA